MPESLAIIEAAVVFPVPGPPFKTDIFEFDVHLTADEKLIILPKGYTRVTYLMAEEKLRKYTNISRVRTIQQTILKLGSR